MTQSNCMIDQSVRRCEELTATFNQRDVFSNEVNLTRARTLAIADAPDTAGGRRKAASPAHPGSQTKASSSGAAKSGRTSQSLIHNVPSAGNGDKAVKGAHHGMNILQSRLQEVEEASATAQARGSSVEAELARLRTSLTEKSEGATGAPPSSHPQRRAKAGGAVGAPRRAGHHAAGGGASAVLAHGKRGGASIVPSHSSETPTGFREGSEVSSVRRTHHDSGSGAGSPSRVIDATIISRVPEAVERGTLAPSEWFQKSTEHLEYPDAEKDVRLHFKKRDEARRGATPVERYTVPFTTKMTEKERAWQEGSAKVSISVIHPDPLAALKAKSHTAKAPSDDDCEPQGGARKVPLDRATSPIQKRGQRRQGTKGASNTAGSGVVEGGDDGGDTFERMQDRDKFLLLARSSRKARRIYESSIAKELLAAANMLGPHVPLFANQPKKAKRAKPQLDNDDASGGDESSFLHRADDSDSDATQSDMSFTSSDSGELCEDSRMEAEREGIRHLGDEDAAVQIPGVRGPSSDVRTTDLQDTCDLIECCVVCLCQQLGGSRSAITREQVILRSIIIHALHSALPPLDDELSRRQAFINKKVSVPPAQRRTDAALISRLLRSWVKGIEVLLTLDLATINDEGVPFSIHNELHMSRMVQTYCRLHEGKDDRVQRLFERWRANKEEADSSIIRNDTAKLLKPPPPQHAKAIDLVNHFRNVAAVTTDDLALLDHETATVTAKQRDLAQVFLDRMTKFLPLPDESKTIAQRRVEQVHEFTEEDLMLRPEPPNLKHVLLHYTGLLSRAQASAGPSASQCPPERSAPAASQSDRTFSFISADVSTAGVAKFLNVFRTSWGRTPLCEGVCESEAADRATTMQNNTMIMLFDAYFRLLSPLLQERVKLLVRDEKKRSTELRAKMKADAEAFNRALDEISHRTKEDPLLEAKRDALREVERYQLIDKYTVSKIDPETAEKLRKSIENSESWFGYETSRRAARMAAANPQSDEWNDEPPSTGTSDKGQPAHHGGGSSGMTSRMEMIRIRKLQELEACWHKLNIGYSLRVALHDKWNHATKELRHIDAALKLYRECITAVEIREAAVERVLENEKNTDKAERNSKRSELFAAMCSAGQKCELVAKKLFNDSGDELFVKSDMYLAKIRDDFARISKMIRTVS